MLWSPPCLHNLFLAGPTFQSHDDGLPRPSNDQRSEAEGGDRVSCHRGKVITDFEDYNTSIYLVSEKCRNSVLKPFVTNIFHLDGLICNANPSLSTLSKNFQLRSYKFWRVLYIGLLVSRIAILLAETPSFLTLLHIWVRFIGGEGKVAMAAVAYSASSPCTLKMQHSLCCSISGAARASKVTCGVSWTSSFGSVRSFHRARPCSGWLPTCWLNHLGATIRVCTFLYPSWSYSSS